MWLTDGWGWVSVVAVMVAALGWYRVHLYQRTLAALLVDMGRIRQAVVDGELATRIDPLRYTGESLQVVQGVNEVMSKVNHAQWQERIEEQPSQPQLIQLKQVINESIIQLHHASNKALHQERLTTIGNMAAAMAHEINNPIAGIIMNLQYLEDVSDSAEYHEVVEETLTEVIRVGRLVKTMLGFSRTTDGLTHNINLYQAVEESIIIAEPLVKTAGVLFEYEVTALKDQLITGSADSVKQVLLNLITNSVQAITHADVPIKRIQLDAQYLDGRDQLLIRVTDTGTGIPDRIKDKIFDPFFTTKPQGEGTGLGLSICVKLIDDMGGKLRLDDHYTQGARFLLYLPVHKEPNSTDKPTVSSSACSEDRLHIYSASLAKALGGGGG